MIMNLSDIIVNTKKVDVDFPGIEGFVVTLSAISRETSRKLKKDAEITKIDPKLRMPVTSLDEDKFLEAFAAEAIKGWKGLTYEKLPELILVDISKVEDKNEEVDFNLENCIQLLKHSPIFDTWVNDQVFDIERFRD